MQTPGTCANIGIVLAHMNTANDRPCMKSIIHGSLFPEALLFYAKLMKTQHTLLFRHTEHYVQRLKEQSNGQHQSRQDRGQRADAM